ncbi:MAG: hypothetical protein IT567_04460 [Alphaproteobacteria bacterium]|nr:hypothetical protein [Alphaproteobacteria bacterium]
MAKILIVDDELEVRELLTKVLGIGGHSVIAADGPEMADRFKREGALKDVDLAIVDGLNGEFKAVIQSLSKVGLNSVLLSADDSVGGHVDTARKLLEARTLPGLVGVLTKPVHIDELLGTVAAAISGANREV